MSRSKFAQIILGAGLPYKGYQNTSLKKISSEMRVLDWTIQTAKYLSPEVHFVAGYQKNEIISSYPDLHITYNHKWDSTGPVVSLLKTNIIEDSECIVSYGDILFREKTIKKLINLESEISIAVDSVWKKRYSSRTIDDLISCEKVIISDNEMISAGSNIDPDKANAEFIGLLTFKPNVMKFLKNNSKLQKLDIKKANLSFLLMFLKKNGFSIKIIDVEGDWAEMNEAHDLANFILGTKAQTLARLENLISLSKIEPQVSFTVSEWRYKQKEIISDIQKKFQSKKLIIRSSAISEDSFYASNAGTYLSILHINSYDEISIINSVNRVIGSYKDNNFANQVLIQSMIERTQASGVIFTRTLSQSAPYYVVNFDDSTYKTDSITSGSSTNHKTLIVSRSDLENNKKHMPLVLSKLIPAIQEIEKLLDFSSLDIEFAIGSENEIHILQVRPLVSENYEIDNDLEVYESIENSINSFRRLQKNSASVLGKSAIFGVMPDWNPAEIIGTKPYYLSYDLYGYLITNDIWSVQRAEYGYRNVKSHPLLVSFSGLPYVDVRASFNSFIPKNISDELAGRLVDFYQGTLIENPHYHDKVEFEVVPTCYAFDFANWREKLFIAGFSENEINDLKDGLKCVTNDAIYRTARDLDDINKVKDNFNKIIHSNLSILDKVMSLLEDCRNYGTLVFAHLARSAFISITLLRTAVDEKIISKNAMDDFLNSIETVAHEFVHDAKKVAKNEKSWKDFIDRYGHLRPGTYDITSESYSHNIDKFLRPVVEQSKYSQLEKSNNINQWQYEKKYFSKALSNLGIIENTETIENFLRKSIEGREYAKFIFSRNLSAALDLISEYGHTFGLSKIDMANISLKSLKNIQLGNIKSENVFSHLANEIKERKREHHTTKKIELPPLITKEQDFKIFIYPNSQPNYVGTGRVSGEVHKLGSENINHQDSNLENKILLIPQADPGFDWIFGHNILGLITKYGGGNSHMAIRAKEFGLPAAIGVGEALYNSLSSASIIDLDVTNRKIEVIR